MREQIIGELVDIHTRTTYQAKIEIEDGVIKAITPTQNQASIGYIIPPLVDSHLHIESSMLTPEHFGKMVARRGTVAVVTDPHEIANVMGVEGIEFMLESAQRAPIECYFTIPSCVPATPFDSNGAEIDAATVERLAASGRFVALSEVMNVPGVVLGDKEVAAKLASAKKHNLPIDGHAPLLQGEELKKYIAAGITTDHECTTIEEAMEKIALGMKIQIREGSAACNYKSLKDLIATNPESVLFCTDDSHPDEILNRGHIDKIVRSAISDGFDIYDVLRCASKNAIDHYSLPLGQLRVGDRADMVIVDNLKEFNYITSYIGGKRCEITPSENQKITKNNFHHEPIRLEQLRYRPTGEITTIDIIENEIVTKVGRYAPSSMAENLESDIEQDIAKIVYINRYSNAEPIVAFVRGFGLKRGAMASSISHDSHNILAIGCSDRELHSAINEVIRHKGALVSCQGEQLNSLPLPIAGIMSDRSGEQIAAEYEAINTHARAMGCPLAAPYMTLSFLSLVVIPELKIGERGLFSYSRFGWL